MHISPRTVGYLRELGHDVVRVVDVFKPTASDEAIVELAEKKKRAILTQDLDFSSIVALSKRDAPSIISLRLSSSRIESVNFILKQILPRLEDDVIAGSIVTVSDERVRTRKLPIGSR